MKKILLAFAALAVSSSLAVADDYKVWIGTELENYQVTNFAEVQEGQEITIKPEVADYGGAGQIECLAYIKAENNTDQATTINVKLEKVYDNNVGADDKQFQTCIGMCGSNPFEHSCAVAANSSTSGGMGDHMGYSIFYQGTAPEVTFDAKFNCTITVGTLVRHITLLYTSNSTAVETIETAGAQAEYYNLQGVRVSEPQKGQIYIMRKGSEVRKVVK